MKHQFLQIKPAHFILKVNFFVYFLLLTSLSYSQQPTQEWVARYQRPSGSSGIANQMALDKVGNCYVLGNSNINNGVMVLIKYNSIGDTLWTRTFQGGANVGVISDSVGNVYITGYYGPTFGPYDIITIKYNPQGVQLWIKTYDSGSSDEPADIILDKQGNVYLAGFTSMESLIIKYNPVNGDTVWTRKYTETNYRFPSISIALDGQNNIIIGGNKIHTTNGGQVFFTIKYDSNAVFQWVNIASINFATSLAKVGADVSGNVFATGRSAGRMLTVKYNSSGIEQWQRVYDGPGSGSDRAEDMGIDKLGNIIVTGVSSGVGSASDYVTIKYNTIGDSLWIKRYNGTGNAGDESYSLDLDDSNNIYITGRSINSGVSWDYVTIKYTPSGSQAWIATYNNQFANGEDIAYKVAVDKNRNVFVTGISDRGGIIFDYVTIKYSQPVGIINISNHTPNQYYLYQNYPNPFNPSTNIKYQISKSGYVKLIVYNVLGSEVATLVNHYQQAGTYKVDFDASNYSSGVYFYKIITEKFSETKKMLMVK